jgi:hypothetical protein
MGNTVTLTGLRDGPRRRVQRSTRRARPPDRRGDEQQVYWTGIDSAAKITKEGVGNTITKTPADAGRP